MHEKRCEALHLAVQMSLPRRGRYVNSLEDRWQSGFFETLARRAEVQQFLDPMDIEDGFGDCLTDIIVEGAHFQLFACGGGHRRSWKYEVASSASVFLYIDVMVNIIRRNCMNLEPLRRVQYHGYGWLYANPRRFAGITKARPFLSHG